MTVGVVMHEWGQKACENTLAFQLIFRKPKTALKETKLINLGGGRSNIKKILGHKHYMRVTFQCPVTKVLLERSHTTLGHLCPMASRREGKSPS